MAPLVENLIEKSLFELKQISCENEKVKNHDSRLIFPIYRNNNQLKRISEQEAKLLFIRELERQKDFFYSVEAPTNDIYCGFSTEEPKIGTGRSGSIDIALYKENEEILKREHLIEYKFGNVVTCRKDFLKLLCDNPKCTPNYYVNILNNFNSTTKKSIEKKFKTSLEYINKTFQDRKKSELKIYVFIYSDIDQNTPPDNFLQYDFSSNKLETIKTI